MVDVIDVQARDEISYLLQRIKTIEDKCDQLQQRIRRLEYEV